PGGGLERPEGALGRAAEPDELVPVVRRGFAPHADADEPLAVAKHLLGGREAGSAPGGQKDLVGRGRPGLARGEPHPPAPRPGAAGPRRGGPRGAAGSSRRSWGMLGRVPRGVRSQSRRAPDLPSLWAPRR